MNVLPAHALMEITSRPSAVFLRGEGSWLWDGDGKRHLDFVQGWAVNTFGHCPPFIADVLTRQARTLITPGPAFRNQPAIDLAARIVEHSSFGRVFFTNSGAESNEGAIKRVPRAHAGDDVGVGEAAVPGLVRAEGGGVSEGGRE